MPIEMMLPEPAARVTGGGSSIEFNRVEHWFDSTRPGEQPRRVLHPVNFRVRKGEFVSIVGPSGCGKTTLLNMVGGLIRPGAGSVTVGGHTPMIGAPNVGYLFARDALVPWRTAAGNVSLALEFRRVPPEQRPMIIEKTLAAVGLADFADAYPSQLSHGMRQRVAIARTLAPSPDTLLMDEPFSALDAQTRLVLQEQFAELWQERGSTVILVTHDSERGNPAVRSRRDSFQEAWPRQSRVQDQPAASAQVGRTARQSRISRSLQGDLARIPRRSDARRRVVNGG